MSNKPFILLTGDDSVRAEGIILVKRIVEKFADFQIIATKNQQSAVGSKITPNKEGVEWGFEDVDGHKAIWVDGTPVDAVAFANSYIKRKVDLVVSGVNTGENPTNYIHRSGTISAAMAASGEYNHKAIAFSLRVDPEHWHRHHDGSLDESLIDYPGKLVEQIIHKALNYDFPPKVFWNVNFPMQITEIVKLAECADKPYFILSQGIGENRTYSNVKIEDEGFDKNSDVHLLLQGFATLTPCKVEFTNVSELEKMRELGMFE